MQLDDTGPAEAALPGPPSYELSETMRAHTERFVDDVLGRLPSQADRLRIVEMASHGGYLFPFLEAHGIPSLIVEGSPALAQAATASGYRVLGQPFGEATAQALVAAGGLADVVIDNYLLAHIPDPDDYAAGVRVLLRPGGIAVLELDHLLPLILDRRFDSIRHGHFSYFGLIPASALLERHGLTVFHVAPQPVYGGALRLFVAHPGDGSHTTTQALADMLELEQWAGLSGREAFEQFAREVGNVQSDLRQFLESRRAGGETVVGYGAPSRGNTLLNAAGITSELLAYTVDRSPLKQGRWLPGSHVPIHGPDRILETRPDYVLILTWDIQHEVMTQMRTIAAWGGRFVIPIPRLQVLAAS
jgi:hypothetical protein